jgi:alpha-beta hydrolase superfamily lysophospholipase
MIWLRRIGRLVLWILSVVALCALVGAAFLAFPLSPPPPSESIRARALAVDRSGMPDLSRFQTRDGTSLAYRLYPAPNSNSQKIAIVIHGSGGHSTGMNEIAKRLAADNVLVVAPDIRGHGGSGTRGDIGYYGQLDDDLEDLVGELRRQYQTTRFALLGFSSGGGFACARQLESCRPTLTGWCFCRPISAMTQRRPAAQKAPRPGPAPISHVTSR